MTAVVVDTDVVSFLFKNHPLARLYEEHLRGRTLLLSFMRLAELDRWAIQYQWGETRRGRRIECADAWIAATALLHDVPLVTHNRGDYAGVTGLNLLSHGE